MESTHWASLVPKGGPQCPLLPPATAAPVLLNKSSSTVGRSARNSDCPLTFATQCSEVSGIHFWICEHGVPLPGELQGKYTECMAGAAGAPAAYVMDRSTNGTFVDGQRLDKDKLYLVRVGAVISLAGTPELKAGEVPRPVYELVLNDHHSRKWAAPTGHAVPEAPSAPVARFPRTVAVSTPIGVPHTPVDADATMSQGMGGADAIAAPAPPSPTCVLPPFDGALNAAAKPAAVSMQLLSPAAAAAAAVASDGGGEDFMALAAELRVSNTELREKLAAAEEEATKTAERAAALAAAATASRAELCRQHAVAIAQVTDAAQESAKAAHDTHQQTERTQMSALLTAADTRATASEAMTVAAQASLVDAEQSVVRLKEKLEFAFTERSQVAEQHRQEKQKTAEELVVVTNMAAHAQAKITELEAALSTRDEEADALRQRLQSERKAVAEQQQSLLELRAKLLQAEEGRALAMARQAAAEAATRTAVGSGFTLGESVAELGRELADTRAEALQHASAARRAAQDAAAAQESTALLTAQMRSMHTNFEQAQRSMAALERHFLYNKTLLSTLPAAGDALPAATAPAVMGSQGVVAADALVAQGEQAVTTRNDGWSPKNGRRALEHDGDSAPSEQAAKRRRSDVVASPMGSMPASPPTQLGEKADGIGCGTMSTAIVEAKQAAMDALEGVDEAATQAVEEGPMGCAEVKQQEQGGEHAGADKEEEVEAEAGNEYSLPPSGQEMQDAQPLPMTLVMETDSAMEGETVVEAAAVPAAACQVPGMLEEVLVAQQVEEERSPQQMDREDAATVEKSVEPAQVAHPQGAEPSASEPPDEVEQMQALDPVAQPEKGEDVVATTPEGGQAAAVVGQAEQMEKAHASESEVGPLRDSNGDEKDKAGSGDLVDSGEDAWAAVGRLSHGPTKPWTRQSLEDVSARENIPPSEYYDGQ